MIGPDGERDSDLALLGVGASTTAVVGMNPPFDGDMRDDELTTWKERDGVRGEELALVALALVVVPESEKEGGEVSRLSADGVATAMQRGEDGTEQTPPNPPTPIVSDGGHGQLPFAPSMRADGPFIPPLIPVLTGAGRLRGELTREPARDAAREPAREIAGEATTVAL